MHTPLSRLALVLALAACLGGQAGDEATVAIDAATVENRISPRLYGQFAEFMFENIKFGLHAELLRNRGFEEAANAIGLPRDWERDPDDRERRCDPVPVGRFGGVSAVAAARAASGGAFAADRSRGAATGSVAASIRPVCRYARGSSTAARSGCARGTSPDA